MRTHSVLIPFCRLGLQQWRIKPPLVAWSPPEEGDRWYANKWLQKHFKYFYLSFESVTDVCNIIWSYPPSILSFPFVPQYVFLPPSYLVLLLLFFKNLVSPVNIVCIWVGTEPSTRAGTACQEPYPPKWKKKKKMIPLPLVAINCQHLLS